VSGLSIRAAPGPPHPNLPEPTMTRPSSQDGQPAPPNLELPHDLEPIYANLVRITHSPSEIVIDFAQILPGSHGAQIKSRVLMSPLSAKLFYRALGENLAKFEANFGEIQTPGDSSLASQLFKPFSGPPGSPPSNNSPE
jgi:hypothetical protein